MRGTCQQVQVWRSQHKHGAAVVGGGLRRGAVGELIQF